MLGLLLPILALKFSRVEQKLEKELTASPKLAPFYSKRLKSIGAKVLSASALISDNTVRAQLPLKLTQFNRKCCHQEKKMNTASCSGHLDSEWCGEKRASYTSVHTGKMFKS